MSVTDSEQTLEAPVPVAAPAQPPAEYDTCEPCGAPVDANQRYCVVCGTRRTHVHDPAARFLADATSRSRSAARATRGPAPARRRSPGLALALVLAAIPLAVAAGALIGGGGNNSNSKLLAALRAQKPTVVNVTGGGGGTGAATASTAGSGAGVTTAPAARLTSTFALEQGYTVELETLPGSGTTQAAVTAAERHARAKGAAAVGLISQADFKITPTPPAGDYVIYSGQYHSSADATAALTKLKHAFAAARVIAVGPVGGSTPVLSTTAYGTAHQVTGFKPTASQLATGGQVASQESKEVNGNYVKSQQGLPDSISVP